jgi:hypothetical protein
MTTQPGIDFARAVAAKDRDRLRAILADAVDFRGMTPGNFWEASTPDEVLEILFDNWFEDKDHIEELLFAEPGDDVVDRHRVSYRFRIENPDGPHECEQQMYYESDGGRITLARVMCSGFRPMSG